MDDAYREYYRRRISDLELELARFRAGDLNIADIRGEVGRATGRLEARQGMTVREDADLFLLMNTWELAAAPVMSVRGADPGELMETVSTDLDTVLERAADDAREAGLSEVSAHRVVNGLSRSWERLKLSRYDTWE